MPILSERRAVLLGQCKDRPGLVAQLSGWVYEHGGNILQLSEHVDAASGYFFVRIHWDLEGSDIADEEIERTFRETVAEPLGFSFSISVSSHTPRLAIFVTRASHCIWDILARHQSGELEAEIPLIISNHEHFRDLADKFGIPYHVFPKDKDNKHAQEQREIALLEAHDIDVVVLARYMQILSGDFIAAFPNRIINIHHSFLPAFAGAKPYHRAHERGVKLIGATAHYVTEDLDEGPIIEQETTRVTHRDAVPDMIRKGRDLEKVVLSRALQLHLNRQVIVHDGRTLIM